MTLPQHTAAPTPIFVVGYMHSGTTLLFNLLARHPQVFAGRAETKFFVRRGLIVGTFPDLQDDDILTRFVAFVIRDILDTFDLRASYPTEQLGVSLALFDTILEDARQQRGHAAIFRLVFDHLATTHGKSCWLEKTPAHVFYVDDIARSLPDAKFVEIVRDPRDVLASKKTRRATVWTTDRYNAAQRPEKHLEKAYDPYWDALSWKSAVRARTGSARAHDDARFIIRYEDLVRDPELHARTLCSFLGLPFMPEMLDISYRNAASKWGPAQRGIQQDSLGRWKGVLTSGERALVHWVTHKELISLGYPTDTLPRLQYIKLPFLLLRSLAEFFLRLHRRWRRGDPGMFMTRLRRYIRQGKQLRRP